MENSDLVIRHLMDLCRKSEKISAWQYSGFLSPAEQDAFLRQPEAGRFSFQFLGGYDGAERRILAAGDEAYFGFPAEAPIAVVEVAPLSLKFAEDLTHRDFLGAILGLGIDRSLIGDILVREKKAWVFCLDSAAGILTGGLNQVRRTSVSARVTDADIPDLQPRFESIRINIASERLDAIAAAFAGISRGQCLPLFSAEKVFVNGRSVTDKSMKLKEGDILSVRGYGKAIYDGIERETKKNRLWASLRRYI